MRTIAGTTWSVEAAQAYIKARVAVDANGCWIWQRAIHHTGYGVAQLPGITKRQIHFRAHRLAYISFVAPVSEMLCVCHHCDVPACCNPDHLWLGTTAENNADRSAKGRTNRVPMPESSRPRGERVGTSKLTASDVIEIRQSSQSQRQIAREFGISKALVYNIQKRICWAHLPSDHHEP